MRAIRICASIFAIVITMIAFQNAAPVSALSPAASDFVKKVSSGPENTFFTYTHFNGFYGPDNSMILAQTKQNEKKQTIISFVQFNPVTEKSEIVGEAAPLGKDHTFHSVSENGFLVMANTTLHTIELYDLKKKTREVLYTTAQGFNVGQPDINKDATKVVFTLEDRRQYPAIISCPMEFNLIKRKLNQLTCFNWVQNHTHFSPFNDNWKVLSHEGAQVPDRAWAWHWKKAPEGKVLSDQRTADGRWVPMGHERAMFHKPAEIMVGYGEGLFEIGFNGVTKQLTKDSTAWHVNISRDGRWAVTDGRSETKAPEGVEWNYGDIAIINLKTGERKVVYRTTYNDHPYHPHPHISPDGRWIVFNDYVSKKAVAIEIDQEKLEGFLAPEKLVDRGSQILLRSGEKVFAKDVRFSLNPDGNLALKSTVDGRVLFSAGVTYDCADRACRMHFQEDGNLVLYKGSVPYWSSKTSRHPGARLEISAQAPYLKIIDKDGQILFQSDRK